MDQMVIPLLIGALSLGILLGGVPALLLWRRRDGGADGEGAQALRDSLHQLELANGQAQVRIEDLNARLAEEKERAAGLERRLAEKDRTIAEKDTALARAEQRLKDQQEAQQDWEKTRGEFLAMAKSSVSETASEVSNKLLKDHKQENEAAKKEAEQRVQKLSADLVKQVEKLGQEFVRLDEIGKQNREAVSTVLRALSAPGTSGHAAQTTLGNVLKSFGLVEGRDYQLEYTVDGHDSDGRLRPDAVLFMPSDTVLVIDSKSSKHLMELAEAEEQGDEAMDAARERFKRSMNQHLKDLTAKDYRTAVSTALRAAGRDAEARQVLTVMWLPNEGAVEKLGHADPQFVERAARSGIYVAGPSGLWAAIGIAESRIKLATQQDNLQSLVARSGELVDRVSKMLDYAAQVGTAISRAAEKYDRLAGSANSRVLPTMRKMGELGLTLPTKGLPDTMTRLQVLKDAIDTDVEPVADEPQRLEGPKDED